MIPAGSLDSPALGTANCPGGSDLAGRAGPSACPTNRRDRDAALGNEFDVAAGIAHAAEAGAHIINLSLSLGESYVPSTAMIDALDAAEDAGCMVIAAAGNSGSDIVEFPAALRNVVAVGAIDGPVLANTATTAPPSTSSPRRRARRGVERNHRPHLPAQRTVRAQPRPPLRHLDGIGDRRRCRRLHHLVPSRRDQ